MEYIQN